MNWIDSRRSCRIVALHVATLVSLGIASDALAQSTTYPHPWIIEHRGGTVDRPENTLLTYDYSLDNDVTGVEFDVWLSSDGFPVCHHDLSVDRPTNGTGLITDKTLSEILALDIKDIAYVPTLVSYIENESFPKDDVWVWNRFGTGGPFEALMPEAHVVTQMASNLDREFRIYQRTLIGEEAITRLEDNPVPGGLSGLSEQTFDTLSRYMPFGQRMLFANRWLFNHFSETQLSTSTFGNAMLRTTTAATMLSASIKINVLPIESIATVNFRLHLRDTVESVTDYVKSVVENDRIEVRVAPGGLGQAASSVSEWRSVGYEAIEVAIRKVYGDVIVAPGLMVGGSDSRHYGKVADNAFRYNPMIVSPSDLTGFHETNEKITVHNLAQGTRTYMQIIRHGSSQ